MLTCWDFIVIFVFYTIKMPRPTVKVYRNGTGSLYLVVCQDTQITKKQVILRFRLVNQVYQSSEGSVECEGKRINEKGRIYDTLWFVHCWRGTKCHLWFNKLKKIEHLLNKVVVCSPCQGSLSMFPSNRQGLSCTVKISWNDCKYSLSTGISTLSQGQAE